MKYLLMFFTILLYLPVSGQPFDSPDRKSEIEEYIKPIYSITDFQQIADSVGLSIDELCNYPVIFPMKKPFRISSGFGMRYHPVYKRRKFHTGIDIAERKGTPVYATGNGIVTRKGYCSGYGNFIEIQHAGGFRSFYAHLSKTLVNMGDLVEIAQQIACVGNTGVATGSHLHYEVRKGKRFLNPVGWCACLSEMVKNTCGTELLIIKTKQIMLSDFFRINLPYGMVRDKNNSWMAFNREYKPIGYNTDEPVDSSSPECVHLYTFFPGLHNQSIMDLVGYDESHVKRDEHGNICQFWLYSDTTNPMNQPDKENEYWQDYWKKLESLAKLRVMR